MREEYAPTPLPLVVERGVQCFHGVRMGCLSLRCGSNCYSRFDQMHPCPACQNEIIHELREALQAAGENPYPYPRRTEDAVAPVEDDGCAHPAWSEEGDEDGGSGYWVCDGCGKVAGPTSEATLDVSSIQVPDRDLPPEGMYRRGYWAGWQARDAAGRP